MDKIRVTLTWTYEPDPKDYTMNANEVLTIDEMIEIDRDNYVNGGLSIEELMPLDEDSVTVKFEKSA